MVSPGEHAAVAGRFRCPSSEDGCRPVPVTSRGSLTGRSENEHSSSTIRDFAARCRGRTKLVTRCGIGAGGGGRTPTRGEPNGILSPPISCIISRHERTSAWRWLIFEPTPNETMGAPVAIKGSVLRSFEPQLGHNRVIGVTPRVVKNCTLSPRAVNQFQGTCTTSLPLASLWIIRSRALPRTWA
jgi:hypothetical protein